MAMDPDVLGDAIKAAAAAAFGGGGTDEERSTALWRGIAAAIVEHIQQHAEVTPDGTPPLEAGGDAVTGTGKIA